MIYTRYQFWRWKLALDHSLSPHDCWILFYLPECVQFQNLNTSHWVWCNQYHHKKAMRLFERQGGELSSYKKITMFTPTVTYQDLKEWDKLWYRWHAFFSWIIRIWEAILAKDWKHLFIAFTHTAQVVYNRELDCLQRYDAMEWYKTGFRDTIGQAYVFRWETPMTDHETMVWREYLLKRNWSTYDLGGAVTGKENVFEDYCSELSTNADVSCGKIKDVRKRLRPQQYYKKLRKRLVFVWVIL